jgi:hypothetical protein
VWLHFYEITEQANSQVDLEVVTAGVSMDVALHRQPSERLGCSVSWLFAWNAGHIDVHMKNFIKFTYSVLIYNKVSLHI